MDRPQKFLLNIAGAGQTGEYSDVFDPYTRELIAQVEVADDPLMEQAALNCRGAFSTTREIPAYKRAEILYTVSHEIAANRDKLALLIATEGGKPLKDAQVEVDRAVRTVKLSGDAALELGGETLPMQKGPGTENHWAFTVRESLGPVLAICAFNHPVNLVCHQVATAVAAGNPVVLKPAETTPLSALQIAGFFHDAGWPTDALIVVNAPGPTIQTLVRNEAFKYVSFIGSETVGWQHIRPNAPAGAKVVIEHGGTAPCIITGGVDLDEVLPKVVRGAFYHAGQVCVSTQILYVHHSLYADCRTKLSALTQALNVGPAVKADTDVGPLIRPAEVERVKDRLSAAREAGAKVICGGNAAGETCFAPTLVEEVPVDTDLYQKEIFGPVLLLSRFNDIRTVIDEINAGPYSFQASVFTNDLKQAAHTARSLKAKAVIINDPTAFRVDWMPFGGNERSGLGIGGIRYSVEDMTVEKLIVINPN